MKPDQLIEGLRNKDHRAQMEIYRLYYKAMYNTALRILGNTADAEDVMQEGFLNAFQRIQSYRGDVTFGAWLKKIMVNRSLDVIRTRKALISLDAASEVPADDETGNNSGYREFTPEDISRAIAGLPDGYRVVLTLYLIEGYDHDEISEILQISNATSRTQYHRARKQLAQKLNELKAVS